MLMPMLSRKAFATNSLKQTFVWDGQFGCDAHYDNTQSTPYDSNSSIDRARNQDLQAWFLLGCCGLN